MRLRKRLIMSKLLMRLHCPVCGEEGKVFESIAEEAGVIYSQAITGDDDYEVPTYYGPCSRCAEGYHLSREILALIGPKEADHGQEQ
jgi:hypothetical protein